MKRLIFLGALFFVLIPILSEQVCLGQIPQTISYQGILTDAGATAIPDGSYNLTFKLYHAATDGTLLWSETQAVSVSNGLFNVILGSVNPLNIPFDDPYWLGITVGGDSEFTPRIELTSSAYSLNARSIADSVVTGEKIANGQVVRSINSLTEKVTIKAGENVTITPIGDTLTISAVGDLSDGDWIVSDNNMYSAVSGNVGIGTADPQRILHIANPDHVTLLLEDTGAPADQKKKFINVDNGSLRFGKFTDLWTYTPQLTIDNGGNIGIGTTKPGAKLVVAGQIKITGGSPGIGKLLTSNSNGLASWQTPTAGADNDWAVSGNDMYSIHSGNVGIGTTNPEHKLHIVSTTANDQFCFESSVQHGNPSIVVRGFGIGGHAQFSADRAGMSCQVGFNLLTNRILNWRILMKEYTDNRLDFVSFPSGVSTTRVTFLQNGNVGIGTTNPQGKLDVNGTIYQRGSQLHADYVFEPGYQLESIEDHAGFMWTNKHLKAIPKARQDENGLEIVEFGSHRRGIVEELEKAHIYIEQLHERLEALEVKIEKLAAVRLDE